jgi:hypothetical protein
LTAQGKLPTIAKQAVGKENDVLNPILICSLRESVLFTLKATFSTAC